MTARRESGYSLVEMLVVLGVVAMIATATFSVYETSQRVYLHAMAAEDAQLRARAGLALMAADLRLVGSYWSGAGASSPAILTATDTGVTFMADVESRTVQNGVEMTTSAAARSGARAVSVNAPPSRVADALRTYTASSLNDFLYIANGNRHEVHQIVSIDGATVMLGTPLRGSYPSGSLVRSVERVTYAFNPAARSLTRAVGGSGAQTVINDVSALALSYFDGRHPAALTSDPARIREILLSFTTHADDGTPRTMTSRVRVRN